MVVTWTIPGDSSLGRRPIAMISKPPHSGARSPKRIEAGSPNTGPSRKLSPGGTWQHKRLETERTKESHSPGRHPVDQIFPSRMILPVGCGEPPSGSGVTAAATTLPASAGTATLPEASSEAGSKTPALIFAWAVTSQSW